MQVLVDTSIWSMVLRKQKETKDEHYLAELIGLVKNSQATIIGPIRQEVLSGIKSPEQFLKLKTYLAAFPDILIESYDYIFAAELFNHCRRNGIQGSHIDFLITAVAINHEISVFTLDKDFVHYAKHTRLKLHKFNIN